MHTLNIMYNRSKNLLATDASEIIAKNFSGHIGAIFENEWHNKNKKIKVVDAVMKLKNLQ